MQLADGWDPPGRDKGCSHHYVLAHVGLRQLCRVNPSSLFAAAASGRCPPVLLRLWERVRERCDADGPPTFGIEDLGLSACRIKGFPAVVVRMPPPARMTDAYFVGVVLTGQGPESGQPEPARPRYFTLELNWKRDGSVIAFFCEWADNDSHINYRMVPPDEAAFVSAIEGVL